jgi:drug/metabolite transporter (DMT)-like permease
MRNWLVFAFLSLIWGSSFLWIKLAVQELSPLGVASMRIGLGLFGLLVFMRVKGIRLPVDRKTWLLYLGTALLNTALPFPLIAWAEKEISSGMAAVINGTVPIFTHIIAHFLFHDERLTPKRILGLAFGLGGVIVLSSRELFDPAARSTLPGVLAMLTAIFIYGCANAYARKYLKGKPPMITSTMTLLIASLLLSPAWLIVDRPVHLPVQPITWIALLWLGWLGLSTAYVLYFDLMEHWGPSRLSTIAYVFPFMGMLLGVIFLHEELTWRLFAGACLIVAGIGIINTSYGKSPDPAPEIPARHNRLRRTLLWWRNTPS